MSESDLKIEQLFNSVDNALNKLDEVEIIYKNSKEQFTNELADHLQELAVLSDSQAVRARVIRELYWNKSISETILKAAFGISGYRIRQIAGSQPIEFPCVRNCGNIIKISAKSKTALASEEYYKSTWGYNTCEDCKKRDKIAEEQKSIDNKKEARQRNLALREISWEKYTETPEWIYIRNAAIHDAEYSCEMCNTQPSNLYIYPHKDTLQSRLNFYSDIMYKYYVLCSECVDKYDEFIDREKRDVIKKEFLPVIEDCARTTGYAYY